MASPPTPPPRTPAAPGRYRPLDHLVVRAPLLPVDVYLGLRDRPPDPAACSGGLDPVVRRALALASPSLLGALDRARPGGPGVARLEGKLLRYLIRMATRPTPFGLFAGVGVARWGDRTDLAIGGPPRTRTRLDMEWLLGLVLRLEADPEVRRHLRLVASTAAFERGGRMHLSERAPTGSPGVAADSVSVRATGAVRRALTVARRPVRHADLAADLLAAVPGATPERVDQLIAQLCDAGLLLTDLRPPLTGPDPTGWVVARLTEAAASSAGASRARDQATRLAELAAGVAELDRAGPSEATAAAARGAEPLQVDAALDLRGEGVHPRVGEAVADAAGLLLRMTPLPGGPAHLAAYRRAFLRRYGADRTVPLLELLDPRFGLGPLGPVTGPAKEGGSGRRDRLLLELACRALRERRTVLELDDALLDGLATWAPAPETMPGSLELYVGVAAASTAAIDQGTFTVVVGPSPGATPAGRNLGRFADLLTPPDRAMAGAVATGEPARPGVVVAELVYLPRRLRQANVAVRPVQRGYELVVGTSPGVPGDRVVPLDELAVGVEDGRLRVWWPAGGAEVEVTAGHMLNPAEAPAVCRFLAEVGRDGRAQLAGFSWGPAAGFPFLPRVQAGRVVLRPASWRLTPDSLPATLPASFQEALGRWRDDWKVPRYVRLGGGDRRLLLDLDDPAQAGQVGHELGRGRAVVLHEALPGPADAWLAGPGGRFLCELVVPLALATPPEPSAATPSRAGARPVPRLPAARGERLRPPGSDWLYLKLYGPREDEDELLAGPVRELAEEAVRDGVAAGWFFVRYGDPEPHLRVRFRGVPGRLTGELLPKLCRWAGGLVAAGGLERFAVDTYEREVERFGGADGVAAAEELFVADSRCVAALLGTVRHPLELDRVGLAVLTVDDLLDALGFDPRQRLAWYGRRVADRRASGAEHRRRKATLRPLLGDPRRLAGGPGGTAALDQLAGRRAALVPVAERLAGLAAAGRLQGRDREGLAASFVHLHCNRLLGPDPAAERLVLGLALRARESLDRAPLPQAT